MNFNRKKAIIFLTGIFFFFGLFLFLNVASSADSTIKGKAYWGQYGYIYFNCSDDEIGNRLDETSNLSGAGKYVPPSIEEFHFYSEPCTNNTHGVYIGPEGGLFGEAWNPNFGFISFEHDGIGPPGGFGSFNSPCDDVCNPSTDCIACYIEADQKIYGWARIVSTGDWIRIDGYPSTWPTQIYTDIDNPPYPGTNLELGDFAGTASSTHGNVNFNCETEDGSNTCSTRDYKVYIKDLILSRLSAPNWSYSSACSSGALQAVLRWDRLSGTQTGYEIVVNDVNNLNTSTAVYWSGKVLGSANQHIIDSFDGLEYDTAYYWWLRGYDEDDEPTDWVQYDTNTGTDTDGNRDGVPETFETFIHEFPNPFFTWEPLLVTTGTTTTFTSDSYAYDALNPNTAQSCAPGLCPGYLWETTDTGAVISDPTSFETDINFFNASSTSVTLTVTDASNYYCSTSTTLNINYDLPLWREVKAE